jgi:urease accessory protein
MRHWETGKAGIEVLKARRPAVKEDERAWRTKGAAGPGGKVMKFLLAILAAVLTPAAALAHTGIGDASGFALGFMHPIGGMDHVLAMVSVGFFAYMLGGRALWLVPAAFVAMMAAGGALGISGVSVPFVELGIGLSVVVIGLAAALGQKVPVAAAMALVGLFAVFHGAAHGAEMPQDSSGIGYAAGFMLATALLHAAGIAACLAAARVIGGHGRLAARIGGGAAALAGALLIGGAA